LLLSQISLKELIGEPILPTPCHQKPTGIELTTYGNRQTKWPLFDSPPVKHPILVKPSIELQPEQDSLRIVTFLGRYVLQAWDYISGLFSLLHEILNDIPRNGESHVNF